MKILSENTECVINEALKIADASEIDFQLFEMFEFYMLNSKVPPIELAEKLSYIRHLTKMFEALQNELMPIEEALV